LLQSIQLWSSPYFFPPGAIFRRAKRVPSGQEGCLLSGVTRFSPFRSPLFPEEGRPHDTSILMLGDCFFSLLPDPWIFSLRCVRLFGLRAFPPSVDFSFQNSSPFPACTCLSYHLRSLLNVDPIGSLGFLSGKASNVRQFRSLGSHSRPLLAGLKAFPASPGFIGACLTHPP